MYISLVTGVISAGAANSLNKFPLIWGLKYAVQPSVSAFLSLPALWLSSDRRLNFSLFHYKTMSVPEQQCWRDSSRSILWGVDCGLEGLAHAGWLIENVAFLDSHEKPALLYLIYISRAPRTHPLSLPLAQTHTHPLRVREGEMLDQTDSFGLGKKESSYLETAI